MGRGFRKVLAGFLVISIVVGMGISVNFDSSNIFKFGENVYASSIGEKFTFTTSGNWTVPNDVTAVDVFLVGGGGGGGAWTSGCGGGGGYTKTYKTATSGYRDGDAIIVTPGQVIPVTVGSGGVGGTTSSYNGVNGGYSEFLNSNYRANGGLGAQVSPQKGGDGGSGGGSATNAATNGIGGTGGNDGTTGTVGQPTGGIVGSGQGHTTREFGESAGTLYSGGGGGGNYSNGSGCIGGVGGSGGGAGGNVGYCGLDGIINTGGGGGGTGYSSYNAGKGGSGIVIVRITALKETTPPTIGIITTTSTENSINISGSAADTSGLAPNPYRFTVGDNVSDWKPENILQNGKSYGNTLASIPSFVANSPYDISGNGGRKSTVLSNGWIVSAMAGGVGLIFYVSKDNGLTWTQLCCETTVGGTPYFSIAASGTDILFYYATSTTSSSFFYRINALTQSGEIGGQTYPMGSQTSYNSTSMSIGNDGTIHITASTKNPTYPNSWNIIYNMSTDGGVTWKKADGTAGVDQITSNNTAGIDNTNPCIVIKNNKPIISCQAFGGATYYIDSFYLTTVWNYKNIYSATYAQSNPCATVSLNGRIWCVWNGKDTTDNLVFNLHIKYSDDGGQNWINGNGAIDKITSGNVGSCWLASLVCDKNNNVYVLFDNGQGIDQVGKLFYNGSAWSGITNLTAFTANTGHTPQVIENVKDFIDPLVIWSDTASSSIRFTGKMTSWADSSAVTTVVGSAYVPIGRPQRLSNGWWVFGAINATNNIDMYVSKDNMATAPTHLCTVSMGSNAASGVSMTSRGTMVYVLVGLSVANATNYFYKFDAVTQADVTLTYTSIPDTTQTIFGTGCSIESDQATGYLYATWCSKNTTLQNSFNIRASFSKDGGITWRKCDDSAVGVDQLTINNDGASHSQQPIIIIRNGKPIIIYQLTYPSGNYAIQSYTFGSTTWGSVVNVYNAGTYAQSNPSAVVSPDGVVHVVWQGTDSTASVRNIRYSKSTDGGVTWSPMVKLSNDTSTSGNGQYGASITSDKNNNIYILWNGYVDVNLYVQVRRIIFNNVSWGSISNMTAAVGQSAGNPQLCSNYTDCTDPICIYNDYQTSSIKFRGTWGTNQKVDATYSIPNPQFPTNLTPNTLYPIIFEAKDATGNIATYNQDIYTKAAPPTLAVPIANATSINLAITDPTNPTGTQYQISCGTKCLSQSGTITSMPTWITIPTKTIKATNLTNSTNYTFTIKARNGNGDETVSSNPVSITTSGIPLYAPSGLTMTAINDTEIRITWKPVSGADGYKIEKDGDTVNLINAGTNLYYENVSLLAGSTHKYRVAAIKGTTIGNWSTFISAKTKILPLAPPTTITSTPHGTSIDITWTNVTGAVNYEIELDGTIKKINNKILTYKYKGLKSVTQHTFRIRTINLAGAGDWSTLQTIITTDGIPEIVTINDPILTNTEATLSWNPANDAESYEILEVINGVDDSKIYSVDGNIFRIRGMVPGSSHTYKVRGVNSTGVQAQWSSQKTFTAFLLDTPSNITTIENETSIVFNWSAVQNANTYEISYTMTPDEGQTITQTVIGIVGTTKSLEGLTSGTIYSYSIRAKNSTNDSAWSELATIATLPIKPGIPTNVFALVTDKTITVKWSLVPDSVGYDVELDGVVLEDDNSSDYIHDDLTSNAIHTYRVRARNNAIEGDWSSLQSIKTLPGKPVAPGGITVNSTQTGATITWKPVNGASSYDLEIFDGTKKTVVTNLIKTKYTHRKIAPYVECQYRICTRNVEGISDWSGDIINNSIKKNCIKNSNIDLGLVAADVVDFSKYTLIVTYNPGVIDVVDLCTITGSPEIAIGRIESTDITISEFEPGKIIFKTDKVVNAGEAWTGVINSIKFKAKLTGGTTITYTVLCDAED